MIRVISGGAGGGGAAGCAAAGSPAPAATAAPAARNRVRRSIDIERLSEKGPRFRKTAAAATGGSPLSPRPSLA